jgi:RNA polymerase sigma-70 factor (ECF subfamily)
MDEREDLRAAKRGDAAAIERLLARYQDVIFRYGMRMCRDREDASDVLQETMIAAAKGLPTFRGDAALSSWLYTIARSFCVKKRRRRLGEPAAMEPLEPSLPAAAPDPEEIASARELGRALAVAIDALDEGQRDVLVLRDGEGLTAPQVAEVLGISVEAVKSRLHRGREAVRTRLAPLVGGEPAAPPGCPDVAALLSRHLEDELSSRTCAEMEKHLETCARCRSTCDALPAREGDRHLHVR